MKNKVWFSAVVAAFSMMLAATQAFAGWESFPSAGVRFAVPNGWVTQTQANVVVTHPAAGGTAIEFVAVSGGAQAEVAERQMLQGLARRFQGVQITRPRRPIAQNGMTGFAFGGTARAADGAPMEWASVVLGSGPHGVLALVVGRVGTLEANMPIVRPVLETISLIP